MKQTAYTLVLSDGQKISLPGNSAGEAIEAALRKYRNRIVVECYAGLTDQDAEFARATRDKKARAGVVNFDIPPHRAYRDDETFTRPKKPEDHTAEMFPPTP